MIGRQLFSRYRLAAFAGVGLVALAGFGNADAAGLDPSKMSADEIKALERRLTDAGCYQGAIETSEALDAAIKACPDQRPVLRIETGMHTAPINRLGVDAGCSLLATASNDKTVRLWSLPDGKPKRVVRLPIGEGDAGKIYATTLSLDARLIAIGRLDGYSLGDGTASALYLYRIGKTGELTFLRRTTFGSRPVAIAFSSDSSRLAIGFKGPQGRGVLPGSQGVRIIDVGSGRELLADASYDSDVYGLAFAPDGGLITSSFDGQLRRYGPDMTLTARRAAPEGKKPNGVAIDPSGRRVAVGYTDETPVSILDAKTLAPLARAQTDGLGNGDLSSVAWSRDGGTLVAAGQARSHFSGGLRHVIRRFDPSGRRRGEDHTAAGDDTISDIQPCGEGFAFAAADPSFSLVSSQGAAEGLQGPRSPDMRDKLGSAFMVSRDTARVRFGLDYGEAKPVLFDLAAASLADSPKAPPGPTQAKVDGLPVTDWKDNFKPKFDEKPLALDEYERSRALAIRPDGSGFALGTEWYVRAYDAKGNARWNSVSPGEARGVNFSADGDIVVVAYGDGTIRWLRWSDGEELLALFVEPQSRKWVAWTPSGYYMASAGGEDLIGWHVNRGWTQEADFFPASQFRAQYNRPDIVKLVLKTKDEAEAVQQANATAQREAAKPIAAALPPVVAIASPHEGDAIADDTIRIDFTFRSPSGLGIDRVDVLVDGEPVRASGFRRVAASEAAGHVTLLAPQAAKAKIALIAHSGDLASAPAAVNVRLPEQGDAAVASSGDSCAAAASAQRPKLYALLVGVTQYAHADVLGDLQFPGRDAEGLADALLRQKGCLYADVQTKIVNMAQDGKARPDRLGPPTRSEVFEGLEWLQEHAGEHDLSIVYLDGHGWQASDGFWFLTQEAKTNNLLGTAVRGADLLAFLHDVKGKKLLFLDACYAGRAVDFSQSHAAAENRANMDRVVGEFTAVNTGIVAYAAASAEGLAWEYKEFDRHSAFAKALIEAFGEGGGADHGILRTDTLQDYLRKRVGELAAKMGKEQVPVWNKPQPIDDFPVAVAVKS